MILESQCTPLTNRGVGHTNKGAVEAIADWVQITFHIVPVSAVIEDVISLPITLFKKRNSGIYFYSHGYEFPNIKSYYSSDDESMGTHLQLAGTGCRKLKHHLQQLDKAWQDFFDKCSSVNTNSTRIDIAIDDYKTYLRVPLLIKKAEKAERVSHLRARDAVNGFNLSDGRSKSAAFHIGPKQSNLCCRFYEKNYEQAFRRHCDVEDVGLWNHYEVRMREVYAVNCAKVSSRTDNTSEIVKSVLHNNLRFISPPKDKNDKNRKRWSLYRPWALFIRDTKKLNLTTRPTLKSIEDNLDWLYKQITTTSDTVLTVESMAQSGGLLTDTDFLDKILARSQFNDERTNRINHYSGALEQKKHLSKDKC